jgi:hypothetical protein
MQITSVLLLLLLRVSLMLLMSAAIGTQRLLPTCKAGAVLRMSLSLA